jgi:glycosyltransferase involved in cell wall biosynthesis/N-acetylneuraminic acid mutarotase
MKRRALSYIKHLLFSDNSDTNGKENYSKLVPEDFDPILYLAIHDDVAKARVDPYQHYIDHGIKEGRSYKATATGETAVDHETREALLWNDVLGSTGFPWERKISAPFPIYDQGSVLIGSKLFVVCGYKSLSSVSDTIEVYDFASNSWIQSIQTPDGFPNSHMAVAADDRYIYIACGQVGPQCRPAVRSAFSYDTICDEWSILPSLPAARYAPTMQLWRGRLHLIGGAAEDRWTPKSDHWSLEVSRGRAVEDSWKDESAVPLPAMHRGSIIFDDSLYIFGGQQGDFVAITGDPNYRCTGATQETYFPNCYRLDNPSDDWVRITDMPIAASHTDFSVVSDQGQIFVLGGQIYKNTETFALCLSDAVQCYDPRRDIWCIDGYLPYRIKLPSAAVVEGHFLVTGGQRALADGSSPGPVSSDVLVAKLSRQNRKNVAQHQKSFARGKDVLLLTHDLSRTGAPLIHLQLGDALKSAGARVRIATLEGGIGTARNIANELRLPLVPGENALKLAQEADYTIASTTHPRVISWLENALVQHPNLGDRLGLWVHEIDVEAYCSESAAAVLDKVKLKIFDSHAAHHAWQEKTPLDKLLHNTPSASQRLCDKYIQRTSFFCMTENSSGRFYSEALTRNEIRDHLDVGFDDVLVTCIGTFEERKGQRLLIQTLASLVEETKLPIKALLVGFSSRDEMEEYMQELSPAEQAILSPRRAFLSQSAIHPFYKATDLFVMNSQGQVDNGRGEAFGRVTIEAMAAGNVVLGTEAGGTKEIIDHDITGLLFPVGAQGQQILKGHIADLSLDEERRHALANAGMKKARSTWTEEAFFDKFDEACSSTFG